MSSLQAECAPSAVAGGLGSGQENIGIAGAAAAVTNVLTLITDDATLQAAHSKQNVPRGITATTSHKKATRQPKVRQINADARAPVDPEARAPVDPDARYQFFCGDIGVTKAEFDEMKRNGPELRKELREERRVRRTGLAALAKASTAYTDLQTDTVRGELAAERTRSERSVKQVTKKMIKMFADVKTELFAESKALAKAEVKAVSDEHFAKIDAAQARSVAS
jgi:hypothetical protein